MTLWGQRNGRSDPRHFRAEAEGMVHVTLSCGRMDTTAQGGYQGTWALDGGCDGDRNTQLE